VEKNSHKKGLIPYLLVLCGARSTTELVACVLCVFFSWMIKDFVVALNHRTCFFHFSFFPFFRIRKEK
jgi:hypothetical protein